MTTTLLPLILLLAQRPAQRQAPPEPKPEDYGRIEGVVTNAMTGEPIRRVEIQLLATDRRSADDSAQTSTTGPDGRFSFARVAPGRMALRPYRTGFVQKGGAPPFQLANGQSLTNVAIAMLPQAVVTGRVLDPEGEPLARTTVAAYHYAYPQGRKTLAPSETTTTNDLGEFRLWGLSRGTYYIMATPRANWNSRGRTARSPESETTMAPTFHPAAASLESATPVRLAPGTQLPNVDISVGRARTFRVSGSLVDASTGQAISRASVVAVADGAAAIGAGQGRGGAQDGQFNLTGMLPGSYTLQARTFGGRGSASLTGQIHVDVGTGDLADLRIALRAPETLEGYVKLDEGAFDAALWKSARLQLEPMQDGQMTPGTMGATIGEDGKFAVPNLLTARYRLKTVNVPAGFFLKAIRLGNREVQETGIELSAGIAAAGELGVIFSPAAGSLEGTVRDARDEPSPKTTVVLVPKPLWPGYADSIRTVSSGSDGSFQFAGLGPGEYEVYAFEDAETGSWFDPDFRASYREQARTARVEKKAAAKVDVKVIQAQ